MAQALFAATAFVVWLEIALCAVMLLPVGEKAKIEVIAWACKQPWTKYAAVRAVTAAATLMAGW